jgi:putative iron-regulated protein
MQTARGSVSAWVFLCLLSCGGKPAEQIESVKAALDERALRAALGTYADIALATYEDSLVGAEELLRRSRALVEAPSAARLEAARAAWLKARVPYAQSEVFRFYEGPIDKVELWVNTWPIDESYVESLPADQSAGIVQDRARYPTLSAELLTRLNGRDGETAISTGYHVIEFLLWGRDESETGPGQRTYLDFVPEQNVDAHEQNKGGDLGIAARRADYLTLASELLSAQLREVRDAWRGAGGTDDEGASNYRATFLALPPERALYLALKGMAKLSGPELSGERLTVAYETKNQEHEHSCFSDNTHADLSGNALGIENVCRGRYLRSDGSRVEGTPLCRVLTRSVPELGTRLEREIAESTLATAQIPAPFDRAILGADSAPGRTAIARAISVLSSQAKTLDQIQLALRLPSSVRAAVGP